MTWESGIRLPSFVAGWSLKKMRMLANKTSDQNQNAPSTKLACHSDSCR